MFEKLRNSRIPIWVNIFLIFIVLLMTLQVFWFYFDHQALLDQGITIQGVPDQNIMYTTAGRLVAMIAARFADPDQVARFFLRYAYDLGQHHRPAGQSAPAYVRAQLDRLGLGAELTCVKQGQRTVALPPSCLHNPAA